MYYEVYFNFDEEMEQAEMEDAIVTTKRKH